MDPKHFLKLEPYIQNKSENGQEMYLESQTQTLRLEDNYLTAALQTPLRIVIKNHFI